MLNQGIPPGGGRGVNTGVQGVNPPGDGRGMIKGNSGYAAHNQAPQPGFNKVPAGPNQVLLNQGSNSALFQGRGRQMPGAPVINQGQFFNPPAPNGPQYSNPPVSNAPQYSNPPASNAPQYYNPPASNAAQYFNPPASNASQYFNPPGPQAPQYYPNPPPPQAVQPGLFYYEGKAYFMTPVDAQAYPQYPPNSYTSPANYSPFTHPNANPNPVTFGVQNPPQAPPPSNQPAPRPAFDLNMKWGYITEKGPFKQYSGPVSNLIEQSYAMNSQSVTITSENLKKYVIDFGAMTQKASQGKASVRTVRRLDGRPMPALEANDVVWYWQDDALQFQPFTAEACRQIEHCYRSNQTPVVFQGSNIKGYYVELDTMMQVNEDTGFKRAIKRQQK